jgi:hypothetical protein
LLGLPLLLLLVPACDEAEDPPPLTIEGKSAEEAADVTTEVACDYVARCGLIEVTCADCDVGQDCGGCYVEPRAVTTDACIADLGPDLETGFACQALTPEEEALVDECLAALPTAECTSIEEVEAWANGGGGEDPRNEPAACDVIEEIRYRCFDYGEPGGGAGEPTPG